MNRVNSEWALIEANMLSKTIRAYGSRLCTLWKEMHCVLSFLRLEANNLQFELFRMKDWTIVQSIDGIPEETEQHGKQV